MTSTLTEDLLLEILIRVPVKSLLKCICVCKSWQILITHPYFLSHQTKHHISKNSNKNDHVLVLQDNTLKKKQLTWRLCRGNDSLDEIATVDFPFTDSYFLTVGCISGLVCLLESVVYQPDSLVLWNPMIRRYLVLPSPNSDDNPMSSISVYGFGYAPSCMDYRVVRIMQYHIQSFFDHRLVGPFAEVYSLGKGSWKTIEPPFAMPWNNQQVYSNGSVHWLAYHKQISILRFDSNCETFGEIQVPEDLKTARINALKLEKWVEALAIFEVTTSYKGDIINMWVAKEYDVSTCWSKLLVVESTGIVRSIAGVLNNGKILVNSVEGRFVMYDPKSGRWGVDDSGIEPSKKFQMVSYHESLVLFGDERANRY